MIAKSDVVLAQDDALPHMSATDGCAFLGETVYSVYIYARLVVLHKTFIEWIHYVAESCIARRPFGMLIRARGAGGLPLRLFATPCEIAASLNRPRKGSR